MAGLGLYSFILGSNGATVAPSICTLRDSNLQRAGVVYSRWSGKSFKKTKMKNRWYGHPGKTREHKVLLLPGNQARQIPQRPFIRIKVVRWITL
jgi:hypothetical protein